MIKSLFSTIQAHFEKRRRYLRLIAEIETLNARELQELRADPSQMRHEAWQSIYGWRSSGRIFIFGVENGNAASPGIERLARRLTMLQNDVARTETSAAQECSSIG